MSVDHKLLFLTPVLLVFGGFLLFSSSEGILELRELQRTPVSDASQVVPGPTVVRGTITSIEEPPSHPWESTEVAYFSLDHSERYRGAENRDGWRVVSSKSQFSPFQVTSGGNSLRVVPTSGHNFNVFRNETQRQGGDQHKLAWLLEGDTVEIVGTAAITESGMELHFPEEGAFRQPTITDRTFEEGVNTGERLLFPWLGFAFILVGLAAGFSLTPWRRRSWTIPVLASFGGILLLGLSISLSIADLQRSTAAEAEMAEAIADAIHAGVISEELGEKALQMRLEQLELQRRAIPDRWLRNSVGAGEPVDVGEGTVLRQLRPDITTILFQLFLTIILLVGSIIVVNTREESSPWLLSWSTLVFALTTFVLLLFTGIWRSGGIEPLFLAGLWCFLFAGGYVLYARYHQSSLAYIDDVGLPDTDHLP